MSLSKVFRETSFAAIAVYSRQFDISYVAGWDWINYWPNFLEGMNYTQV